MQNDFSELVSPTLKHKDQVSALTELACQRKDTLGQIINILRTGSDVDRGTAAEICKFVAQISPDKLEEYIPTLIEYIDYKAPRVRWGCPEALGHLTAAYPDQTRAAIPKLLRNLEDKSTVVRWCAAFALTEIAKHNLQNSELLDLFPKLIETEQNNGVKNLYIKALKNIS